MLAGGAKTTVEVSVTAGQPAQRGLLVKPKKDWRAGQQFEVSAGSDCAYGSHGAGRFETTFTIGPEAPLPKQLGTLRVDPRVVGPLVMGTAAGSCSVKERAAYVDVELEPSNEAKAWLAVLEFETLVDGKRWFVSDSINLAAPAWSSWIGRGKDRLYLKCDPQGHAFEGLSAGEHEVVMAATIAGSATRIISAPAKVLLSCLPDQADKPPAPSAGAGAGTTPGPAAGPGSGKSPPSTGSSGRSCGCGAVGQRHSACSCRAAGEHHDNRLAALAALLLVTAAGLRKRPQPG